MRACYVTVLLTILGLSGCALNSPMPKPAPVVERPLAQSASHAADKSQTAPVTKTSPALNQYQVQKGDTLYGISKKTGVPIAKLAQLNLLSAPYALQVGQLLTIAATASNQGTAAVDEDAEVVTAAITPPDGKATTAKSTSVKPTSDNKAPTAKPASASQGVAKEAPVGNPAPPPSEPAPNPANIDNLSDQDIDWQWPIAGNVVANFDGQANKGLNIAGTAGQSVTVAGAGKVIYSGADIRGYGKLVIVKHTSNLLSVYAHQGESLVKEGSLVKAQQPVATLPNTTSPVPVLHFEIRQNGKPVNPLRFLPATQPSAQ